MFGFTNRSSSLLYINGNVHDIDPFWVSLIPETPKTFMAFCSVYNVAYGSKYVKSVDVPDNTVNILKNACRIVACDDETCLFDEIYDHALLWTRDLGNEKHCLITMSPCRPAKELCEDKGLRRLATILSPEWDVKVYDAADLDVYWCRRYPQFAIGRDSNHATVVFKARFQGTRLEASIKRCFKIALSE